MTALQARHFIRANVKGCVVQRDGRRFRVTGGRFGAFPLTASGGSRPKSESRPLRQD
ncbi:hypothetical protein [Burkholderia cepacia]|uniref:hypothetical protein n=1 Tax=Burkholderia cepacia TaxID=292 RepID=UPI003EE0A4E4